MIRQFGRADSSNHDGGNVYVLILAVPFYKFSYFLWFREHISGVRSWNRLVVVQSKSQFCSYIIELSIFIETELGITAEDTEGVKADIKFVVSDLVKGWAGGGSAA